MASHFMCQSWVSVRAEFHHSTKADLSVPEAGVASHFMCQSWVSVRAEFHHSTKADLSVPEAGI
ncbi:MAG: hypothetical protein OEV80_17100, partial [candidate division Zixibacteria bacterium]|nr:hypothetical protein [candidate division Zixibacteria bacterium]